VVEVLLPPVVGMDGRDVIHVDVTDDETPSNRRFGQILPGWGSNPSFPLKMLRDPPVQRVVGEGPRSRKKLGLALGVVSYSWEILWVTFPFAS
jgi:hypothetical protein